MSGSPFINNFVDDWLLSANHFNRPLLQVADITDHRPYPELQSVTDNNQLDFKMVLGIDVINNFNFLFCQRF